MNQSIDRDHACARFDPKLARRIASQQQACQTHVEQLVGHPEDVSEGEYQGISEALGTSSFTGPVRMCEPIVNPSD